MNDKPKKVLVIAGEYPPLKTIGRIRTAKFVMHMRDMGWQPIVLTMQFSHTNPTYDAALESEIPKDVHVYRVENSSIDEAVFSFFKRLRKKPVTSKSEPGLAQANRGSVEPNQPTLKQKLIHGFKSFTKNWLHVPDDLIVWAWRSYRVARDITAKEEVDLIYTSFPPFSSAITGYWLKKKTGIPWVVDYRDLWTDDVLREWIPKPRRWFEKKIEQKLIKHADAVIAVSEQKTDFLKSLVPHNTQQWHTITNGYDTEAFADLLSTPWQPNEHIDLVYTGRLFKNRQGYTLVHALGEIKSKDPELADKARIHFYGGISEEIQNEYNRLLDQYDLWEHFIFHGDVDFETSKKVQVEADYLLLIVDTGKTADGVIPGKLFEYVASKRPIFALCDSAATTKIIREANIGKVVPVNDIEQCRVALSDILTQRPQASISGINEVYLEQFDRRQLTRRLVQVFESLT